jgi:4-amino-4-deoxy-L-arabinose transferase-like glycosyltransferase
MWYWIFNIILALWVLFDARSRKSSMGWVVGVILIGVLVVPFYLAKRNLKPNEVRTGGTAWNVIRHFALIWTLFMGVAGIMAVNSASSVVSTAQNEFEAAGAAIGTGIGATLLFGLWLTVMIVALVIGLFVKNSGIIEKGPTGALENTMSE